MQSFYLRPIGLYMEAWTDRCMVPVPADDHAGRGRSPSMTSNPMRQLDPYHLITNRQVRDAQFIYSKPSKQ